MAKRNYRGSFRGRPQGNRFQYGGPYPQQEVLNARHCFSMQFYNHTGRAIRSLKMKMSTSINFFHREQIESVIPEAFGAFQEDSDHAEESRSIEECESVQMNERKIDIHTLEKGDLGKESENIAVHVSNINSTIPNLITLPSSTNLNSTSEPPVKRQRLSIDSVTSNSNDNQPLSNVDTNANIQNGSVTINESVSFVENVSSSSQNNNIVNGNFGDSIIISSDDEEVEEGELSDEEEIDLCLMCDLCLHVIRGCDNDSEQQMKNHFFNAQHNAASLIEAKIEGDKLIPRYVEDRHCMSNNSIDTNILPLCPECDMVHGSIWTCALHFQQKHDANESGVYGLGKVVKRMVVEVSPVHICPTCKQEFPSASKLHKHWKTRRHFPFSEPSKKQITEFLCKECGRKEQSFIFMRGHILGAHTNKYNGTTAKMQILYIEKTSRLCLLPSKPMSVDGQLADNKRLFTKTVKGLSKSHRRRLKKSVLPSKADIISYKKGVDYDEHKNRYEKFVSNHLHYNRYHYTVQQS